MPRLTYSARSLRSLERLVGFLEQQDSRAARDAMALIVDAVRVLARHPGIGRPVRRDIRELVISHGRTGYVALYRVKPALDEVEVLAIRHQREAGYSR